MSPFHSVDRAALDEISLLCGVDLGQIEDVYDCTPFQLGIAADPAYFQRFVLSISTNMDTASLSDAMNEVVALNQILRTRIVDSQRLGLVQVVLRDDPATCTQRIKTGLDQYIEEQRSASTNLAAPLFRSTIIQDARKLVITIHHSVFDHSSLVSLIDDVTKIYHKEKPSFRAPFKQFVDYCGSVRHSEAKDFWTQQFVGIPGIFPSVPINCKIDASSRTSRRIRTPAGLASPALLPVYLECAWAILAHAYGGGESVAYGVVYSGRNASAAWKGMESTLGPTIATLPVEVAIDLEDTIGEFLKSRQLGRQAVQGCGAAMQLGLNNIRKVSESAKRASDFQTVLNFLHGPPPIPGGSPIKFDYEDDIHKAYAICLTFSIDPSANTSSQGQAGKFEVLADFDESLMSLTAMNRLLVQLEHILQSLTRAANHMRIGQLALLSSTDRLDLLKSNNSIAEPVNASLHAMVRKMAIAHPDDAAVDAWDGRLTYSELVTMADNLAETLRQRGVPHQSVIPCFFEHSRWAVVAAMAVLTVGGVCMNLEPSHPRARHEKLLELTKPHALLCSTALAERARGLAPCVVSVSADTVGSPGASPARSQVHDESEENAYMIFTSGSTGTPKGVVLQHRALVTSLTSAGRYVGWRQGLKALQFTSYIWDASVGEIFGTLIFGGCVCIPSAEQRESGLVEYINAVDVEWIFQTPAGMRNLLSSPDKIPTVKTLVTGGDRVQADSAVLWGSKLRLINAWGPCESSIYATFSDLGPQSKFPETIGKPVGCAIWIADPINPARLVPIGAVGELIIESATVAKGYLNNVKATADAFIDPPPWAPRRSPALTSARRFYRTGDLGRYNDDGSIHFIGRRDHQVKIRGQRLELGELESVIVQHPTVLAVAAVPHASRGRTELVAVLTLDALEDPLSRKGVLEKHSDEHQDVVADAVICIRDFITTKLPSYMVPTQWLVVQALPRAASSKIDRRAIMKWLTDKEPFVRSTIDAHDSQMRSFSLPATATEKTLRTIWSNVLDVPEDQIGRDSSFLRLGGDSITAMQVATRSRTLGLQLSVQTLMQFSVLSAIAAECREISATIPNPAQSTATDPEKALLSPVQNFFMRDDGPASHNHFNQSWLLQLNTSASDVEIKAALQRIVDVHPMLRARFSQAASTGEWQQSTGAVATEGSWRFQQHSISSREALQRIVETTQSSLDINQGPVFAADLIYGTGTQGEKLLFLAAHHLVCDIVSWRVILEDFETLITNLDDLADPTTSFLAWVESETQESATRTSPQSLTILGADLDYWNVRDLSLKVADTVRERFHLEQRVTALLMGDSCNAPFATKPAELLLAATLSAFHEVFPDRGSPAVFSEGHGRGTGHGSLDVSRTVGWFTTIYPVPVQLRSGESLDQAVIATKDCHRSALQHKKWLRDQQRSSMPLQTTDLELLFNFAGHLPQAGARDKMLNWRDSQDYGFCLQNIAGDVEQIGLLSVFCFVQDHRLHYSVDYNKTMAHRARILRWIQAIERTLHQLADELPTQAPKLTVSDVPALSSVGGVDIDKVNQRLGELQLPASKVESIYPCSAVQEGILFAQLRGQGDEYWDRFTLRITATDSNETISAHDLEQAWRSVCQAHSILRTVFVNGLGHLTAFQQILLRETEPLVKHKTLDDDLDISSFLETYRKPIVPGTTPPHTLTIVQNAAESNTHVVFDASHAILDARSMHIITEQLTLAYQHPSQIPRGPDYCDYITWAQARRESSLQYWTSHLLDQKPCLLPTQGISPEAQPASLQVDVPFKRAAEPNDFCRQHGVTIASFAQVVWALVLWRYAANTKASPCFGCLHSGRDVVPNADNIMGPLLTMLISRFDFCAAGVTPIDLMNQARHDSVEGSDKAGCSLGEIHEEMGLGASSLFNSVMSIQPAWPDELAQKGSAVRIKVVQADDPTEYPISVAVAYSKESFRVKLTCKPEMVPSAFATELAQYFAAAAEALISCPKQPLSTINFFRDVPTLPSHGDGKGTSQYWEDHLGRVKHVSAFPSNLRARRVLKDAVQTIDTAVPLPNDRTLARIRLQASWALCLSRLTGNRQVLFGVVVDFPSQGADTLEQTGTAIVPYAVQLTDFSTPRSLSEDVRSWAHDSRPFVPEGRDYIRASRGELGSAGRLDNILSIRSDAMGARCAREPLPRDERLVAVDSHPDDWGCGLAVSCEIRPDGVLSIQANFDSLLMAPTRVDLILRQYEHCLVQMFEDSCAEALLASLDPISNQERSIMHRWSSKRISTAAMCVHDEISQRATEFPRNAAVNAWDGEISYKELDDLSSRLAVQLVEAGVQVGTFVPLFFPKSTAAVVAMLAVMKSGGTFVVMDINHPEKRRAAILAELNGPVALCSSPLRAKLGELGPSLRIVIATDMPLLRALPPKYLTVAVGLDDICYVIYTSGSTGKPKGIAVDHSNTATSVRSYRLRLGMTERTRTLQYVASTFDGALGDILMTLSSGGCLFMPTEEELTDGAGIVQAINRTSANWVFLTPSLATLFLPDDVPTMQTLVLGGEAMQADVVEAWADHVALVNAYGPSETTIASSCTLVRRNTLDHNNIGSPSNCLYWVVDEDNHDRLLPIGCPGELLIQGPNVTRGYLHNPEKTDAVFIDHPTWMEGYSSETTKYRMYKTGDIVQQHFDGSVTYLGRSGPQIKLRGLRMDVAEIEHHLRETLGPKWQVAVDIVHWEEENRDSSLICFLARRAGLSKIADAGALFESELELATRISTALALQVPVYMIPDYYLPLQNLPSTSSDKIDRKALRSIAGHLSLRELKTYAANGKGKPVPHASNGTRQDVSQPESSPSPQPSRLCDKFAALQKAWSDVLGVPAHSIHRSDDWFSVGGNSIKSMRLVAAARKENLHLTVADVFNTPILADMELVASFGTNDKLSRRPRLLQTKNENLFPRICARAPFLDLGSIDSVAVATDAQAWMLAMGEASQNGGNLNDFHIDCKQGLDVARLNKACAEVTRHHPVLRTVFLQLKDTIYQVVLEDEFCMAEQKCTSSTQNGLQEKYARRNIPQFFYETLSSDGLRCHRLRLRIHHALYDAIFLQIVFDDIASAYCGQPLTTGMAFHTWIAQVGARDFTATKAFWKDTLHRSSMTLFRLSNGPCRDDTQTGKLRLSVPMHRFQSSAGTESSVLKAAWATALSRELDIHDVVFGMVTANRSSEFIETDQVLGPCVNYLPVRAYPARHKDFDSLVREIEAQHRASVPHQDLGCRQIIRDCTDWPSWMRLGSLIFYQNHGSSVRESQDSSFSIGNMDCALSGSGPPTDAADVLVVAEPEEDGVNILLQYIPSVIPLEQAERLARNLTTILETGHLEQLSSNTISPSDSTWSLVAADSDEETGKAQSLVTEAWREVKIFRDGVLPEADVSMFDCGADVVSALLLSGAYQGFGHDVSVADIVSNPTQRAQSRLLLDEVENAEKSLGSDNMVDELFPQAYSARAVAPSDSVARRRDVRYDLSDADLIHMDGHIANYVVFPLKEGSKTASISAALETGLSETLAQLPLLAGRVLQNGTKRSYVQCRPHDTCELALRHLDDSFPSYETLRSMHFPLSMLPRALMLPLSMPFIDKHQRGEEGVPCLFLQANFVKGGVVLATAWHHQVADAYSLDTFLTLLAENTRAVLGGHVPRLSTAYDLDIDRTPFVGVSKGEYEGVEIDDDGFPHQLASLVRQGPSRLADMIASGRRLGKIVNMLVHIPEERAAALKKTCLSAARRDESDFVTTYQCVSTLLHRTLVRARLRTGCMQPNEATAIVHAVNLRGRAPEVKPTYFGNAVALSLMTPMTASELVGDEGLHHGTVNSRHDIRNVGLDHLRRYAGAHAAQGADTVGWAMHAFAATGAMMTSWQQMRLAAYDLGFGPPAALRSPGLGVDGQVIFYPTLPGQGVVALVTSREKCIRAMEEDVELLHYACVWDVENDLGL